MAPKKLQDKEDDFGQKLKDTKNRKIYDVSDI